MSANKMSINKLLTGIIDCTNDQKIIKTSSVTIESVKQKRVHLFLIQLKKLFFLSLMISGVIFLVLISLIVSKFFIKCLKLFLSIEFSKQNV
jgi:branched-subunit amino acid transport protein AzlD